MSQLNVYDFGRELLRTNDLDPVYVVLWHAKLEPVYLRTWLLSYWCFYHVGTASWCAQAGDGYWNRMETAAGSKDYPRCHERRHFRGDNARKSVAYLRSRGSAALFDDLLQAGDNARDKMEVVQQWVGFGPWIAFKVTDMLDRLAICPVEFDVDTAMYKGSPTEGAEMLWTNEMNDEENTPNRVGAWAVDRIMNQLGSTKSPPRYERGINAQEAETILCKWKSYMNGHYKLGEDVAGVRSGLLRFARCSLSQRLLAAGRAGELWS